MSEHEYAIWSFNPYADREPRIIPAASSRYWAAHQAAKQAEANEAATVKLIYRYTFVPGMPWEDA